MLVLLRLGMSDQAASSSVLCTFMQCINMHKIYQTGPDPTDKFSKFMHVYACIKFIRVGPTIYSQFMQSHKRA